MLISAPGGLLKSLRRLPNGKFDTMAVGRKMVVGLGNPGKEYADTRHNTGFQVIDSLAEGLKVDVKKRKFGARMGFGEFADKKLILLKPWQYMNRSGQAVVTAVGFYKLGLSDLLVVLDDMDLEPGRIRIRTKGSAGGHNGLADIIEKLGTENFGRLRIGIGQSGREDAIDFVLDKPTKAERLSLDEAVEKAREAVLCWLEYGIEATMNKFNSG
jgi:PTH1 family peptidyl-tRNA hydrolase